jgi:large subunit ribosomal protein L19
MIQIEAVHEGNLRRDLPPFRSGDPVRVPVNITEGDKQRIQVFEGVVLRRRGGGHSATFSVRKLSYGIGVERVFPIESPAVTKVEIKSRGHVRRSRLYYLRGLTGKKARLRSKVRDLSGLISLAEAEGDAAVAEEAAEVVAEAVEAAPEAVAEASAEPVVESAAADEAEEAAKKDGE